MKHVFLGWVGCPYSWIGKESCCPGGYMKGKEMGHTIICYLSCLRRSILMRSLGRRTWFWPHSMYLQCISCNYRKRIPGFENLLQTTLMKILYDVALYCLQGIPYLSFLTNSCSPVVRKKIAFIIIFIILESFLKLKQVYALTMVINSLG